MIMPADVLYYMLLAGQIGIGGLSSLLLYFGVLHCRRDEAYLEMVRCLSVNERLMRIGLIRRWCASVENVS